VGHAGSARKIAELVKGLTFEQYMGDRVLRWATERLVQIIGEAAYQTSRTFRDRHPHVPWVPIIKQRHKLVHDYGEVIDAKIWNVATIHVPALILLQEPLIPPPPGDVAPE
jgi:uncharacterized protein with HEPN domain